ncbi:MAG: flagellin [Qingshengfaniella sp.]
MSSILTNTGAMVALQTLKSTNNSLDRTQNAISTGKDIASAKDGPAIWAVSKVMEADVGAFDAIQNQLGLGIATVGTALAGAENIVETFKKIEALVIDSSSESANHTENANELANLIAEIGGYVNSSQYNGANLLRSNVDGSASGSTSLSIVSSLDRIGSAATANITSIATVDFEAAYGTSGGTAAPSLTADIDVSDAAAAQASLANVLSHMETAIAGAAKLGAAARQMENQSNFISKLSDSLKTGIGIMVDADMEETSARLQALQVQQQLGIQALSIANQAPQNILSLFR